MDDLDTPSSFDDVLFESDISDYSIPDAATPQFKDYCIKRNLVFRTGQTLNPPFPRSMSMPVQMLPRSQSKPIVDKPLIDLHRAFVDLSEADVREALLEHTDKYCCYGSDSLEKMKITNIITYHALHYILDTFCEMRTVDMTEDPYYGGEFDGRNNGPPPLPWDIVCIPAKQFKTRDYKIPVPHTYTIQPCSTCDGTIQMVCERCCGEGRVECRICGGMGTRGAGDHYKACHSCCGSGWKNCKECDDGKTSCTHCEGCGEMLSYIELTIKFKNYRKEHLLTHSGLPENMLMDVTGEDVFQQILPQVYPITCTQIGAINKISAKLIESERIAHQQERQINQRQTLRAIPVTQVDYRYNSTQSTLYLYGKERRIYSPDYPRECCWGCNIL